MGVALKSLTRKICATSANSVKNFPSFFHILLHIHNMIIAQAKRKENIAEYLLYMWQVEDIVRAYRFDIEEIDKNIISRYQADDETKAQIKDWYESLIKMMELENVKKHGHLQINKNVLIRLNDLHVQLLASSQYPQYGAQFYQTLPFVVELRAKTPQEEQAGELETCFNALYGIIMLRLQGKEISKDTEKAIGSISYFIGTLAAYFKKNEEKPLFDNDTQKDN